MWVYIENIRWKLACKGDLNNSVTDVELEEVNTKQKEDLENCPHALRKHPK